MMFDSKPIPRNDRFFLDRKPPSNPYRPRQYRLMTTALILLVFALGLVLYHNRDFWFPDQVSAEEQPDSNSVAGTGAEAARHRPTSARAHNKNLQRHASTVKHPESSQDEAPAITATRIPLPPLEVEVIAGNTRRTLHPGSNTVQIDLARGSSPSRAIPSVPANPEPGVAAPITKAAERVDVSSDVANVVTHSVTPGYPMLARQMKVQGSVILQALIGRDGLIQDLHVVSGPPILAGAAQEAVKQWHFKPHYQGADAIETQAKITVNFTISTN